MPVEKYYLDGNFEKSIDFYYTCDDNICLRFNNDENKNCEFQIDLDLETIEEFIIDLQFQLNKIKNDK